MKLTFRPYRRGDEDRIVALHQSTFGSEASLDEWRWMFLDNPSGKLFIWLAFHNDLCVGQYTLLPISITMQGKPVLALQSLSSMVRPGYQRQGILTSLVELARQDTPTNIPMITFLNENSFPVYTKRYGWRLLAIPRVLFKPLALRKLAESKPWAIALHPFCWLYRQPWYWGCPSLRLIPFEKYDMDIAQLWQSTSPQLSLGMDRSKAWFEWRYALVERNYQKYKIYDEQKQLLGFFVTRIQTRFGLSFCWVMDAFLKRESMLPAAMLALEKQVKNQSDIISLMLPNKSYASGLYRAGYLPIPNRLQPHLFYFCVRDNGFNQTIWNDFNSWHLSWSLHDVL